MSTPNTRSRENTRARLLDAAAQVFAEVGLAGASVEAVCDRAGFTRGAFYSNFESKDELFLELTANVAQTKVVAVRERVAQLATSGALSETSDPVHLVQQVMDATGDDRLSIMLMSEIRIRALRDEQVGAAYLLQEREMLTSIVQIITDIVEQGLVTLRVPAETAARMLMIVWEGMTVRGAMAGADIAELRRVSGEELGRMVQLLLAE